MTSLTILAALASVGLSALAGGVLGAWVYYCGRASRSPVPEFKFRRKTPEKPAEQGERVPNERA